MKSGMICGWYLLAATSAVIAQERGGSSVIVIPECQIKYEQQATLAAHRPGVIGAVNVREGDEVEAGKLLAKLRDEVILAQLTTARMQSSSDAKVREAEAMERSARNKFTIAETAIKEKPLAVSPAEFGQLRMEAEKGLLQIEMAKHELDLYKTKVSEFEAELKTHHFEAPFSGRVVRVFKHVGEALQQGEPMVELVNPKRLKVEGYLPVADVHRLQQGMTVTIDPEESAPKGESRGGSATISGSLPKIKPGKSCTGKLIFVDVGTNYVFQTVRVWADVENSQGHLRSGQTARITITAPGSR